MEVSRFLSGIYYARLALACLDRMRLRACLNGVPGWDLQGGKRMGG
jgi:hypothetical protein